MCVLADSRPTEKRMFQRKSATIHASWVIGCEVSPRAPTSFRIVFVRRGGDTKRYDLEAEDRQMAGVYTLTEKIVSEINGLRSVV